MIEYLTGAAAFLEEQLVLVLVLVHLSKYVFASFSIGMFLMRLVGPRGTLQVGQVLI